MREMILNHASFVPAGWHEAVDSLRGVASGMAALVNGGAAQPILRMQDSTDRIRCADGRSLFEAFMELRGQGERDSYLFLVRLSQKVPLLNDLGPDITERFQMCDATTLPRHDGAPLVLCAITDAIAVGFPSEPVWDRDRLPVDFHELLPNDAFADAHEEIDHLTRSAHAGPILDRHRDRLRRQCLDAADLWTRREQMFPHLAFGPDVEDHLAELNAGWLPTLVNRLAELDETAAAWVAVGGDAPPWKCKVTPESQSVRDYKQGKLLEARTFRAAGGERVPFEWHARFGSGARIHLRFDALARRIEIGYVGVHLPLPPP